MSADLSVLRELAEAATPGPWEVYETTHYLAVRAPWHGKVTQMGGLGRHHSTDAAFIAAANPTAVLALLDRLEAAEAAVERVRALAGHWQESWDEGQSDTNDPVKRMVHLDRAARGLRAALDAD